MLNVGVVPCKGDTGQTVFAKTVKLGIHTSKDKRATPFVKVRGQRSKSMLKIVKLTINTVYVKLFELGMSNSVHILIMTRGQQHFFPRPKVKVTC